MTLISVTVLIRRDHTLIWSSPPFDQTADGIPKLVVPAVDHPLLVKEPGWYIGTASTRDNAITVASASEWIPNSNDPGGKR